MACPHCGSWAVRSDRALAGRMVCGRCGQPLGRGGGMRGGMRGRGLGAGLGARQRLWLCLLGLVLVSAVLASLDQRAPRQQRPPTWSSDTPWNP